MACQGKGTETQRRDGLIGAGARPCTALGAGRPCQGAGQQDGSVRDGKVKHLFSP